MKNVIAAILLLIIFVLSGINKISTYDSTVDNLKTKLSEIIKIENLDMSIISNIIIVIVILLEIIAPIVIIYYIISKNEEYKAYAKYSVWGIIIFTIFATIMYHIPKEFSYYKSISFLTHISILGGLILLLLSLN